MEKRKIRKRERERMKNLGVKKKIPRPQNNIWSCCE